MYTVMIMVINDNKPIDDPIVYEYELDEKNKEKAIQMAKTATDAIINK